MTTVQIIEKVNLLEKQIESIKWTLVSLSVLGDVKRHNHSIVKATSGMLGKGFPSGTTYENRIRKSWNKRFNQ